MDCQNIFLPSLSDDEKPVSPPKKMSAKILLEKENKLLKRRGFIKPLNLSTVKANSTKVVDFSSLIKEMKDYCSTKTSLLPSSHKDKAPKANNLEYIFAQPNSAGSCPKEDDMIDFLNKMGIFQINTAVVMKELKFNK